VNRKLALTLILILAGLGGLYLFSGSLIQESVVIADADTIVRHPERFHGRELRVRGFVKPGSIVRTANQASFIIEHNGQELPVFFTGRTQLPDTFADAAPVRADGHLENGQLVSTRVEAKCASKYEAEYAEGRSHPSSISLEYNGGKK
jgi:cytochrome c-type biogenesis protein CcmE